VAGILAVAGVPADLDVLIKRIFLGKYYLFLERFFGQTWQKQPSCRNRNQNVNFKLV
jgi:hypothetical protein